MCRRFDSCRGHRSVSCSGRPLTFRRHLILDGVPVGQREHSWICHSRSKLQLSSPGSLPELTSLTTGDYLESWLSRGPEDSGRGAIVGPGANRGPRPSVVLMDDLTSGLSPLI